MPHLADGAKSGPNKGSPRIIEHVQSQVVKDGDKEVTFKCLIKGKARNNCIEASGYMSPI